MGTVEERRYSSPGGSPPQEGDVNDNASDAPSNRTEDESQSFAAASMRFDFHQASAKRVDTPSPFEVADEFDPAKIADLGRAANEVAFESWLNCGEQTTLADQVAKKEVDFHDVTAMLRVEFHTRDREKEHVGSGFGKKVIRSLKRGVYDPATLMESLMGSADVPDEVHRTKELLLTFFDPFRKFHAPGEDDRQGALQLDDDEDDDDEIPSSTDYLEGSILSVVGTRVTDYQQEIAITLAKVSVQLSSCVLPLSFYDYLSTAVQCLNLLAGGNSEDTPIRLPTMFAQEPTLIGAKDLLLYVKNILFHKANLLGVPLYAAEWVCRYTIAFVNSREALDESDALAREEIVAECTQMLADFNQFIVTILTISSKVEMYDEFYKTKAWVTAEAEKLLVALEGKLDTILKQPFDVQRAILQQNKVPLQAQVFQCLNFLVTFDEQWSSTVTLHEMWKQQFLDECYDRLHGNVAQAWMTASLGYIDPILHTQMKDELTQNHKEFRKRISMATKVERCVAQEEFSPTQVSDMVKGIPSAVLGVQLCMGARFLLEETTAEHDEKWGFSMCDSAKHPKTVGEDNSETAATTQATSA